MATPALRLRSCQKDLFAHVERIHHVLRVHLHMCVDRWIQGFSSIRDGSMADLLGKGQGVDGTSA